ncbi:MAG: hypothetical protein RL120_05330 [Gammaproteobacteria bacterium]
MRFQSRLLPLYALVLLLSFCTAGSGGGADYRNEVGANGLLTPRALFARYVDALGGEAVLRSHQSKRMSGNFELAAFGVAGEMEMIVAAPNLVKQNIILGGLGEINSGYNGEVGWSSDPLSGLTRLQGESLNDVLRQAEYFLPLTYASIYPSQETLQLTDVNGEQAYEMRLLDVDGGESTFYFAADSGLLIRTITDVSSPAGEARTVTDTGGWREYDGELMPTVLEISQAGQNIVVELSSIRLNDVSSNEFSAPAGI